MEDDGLPRRAKGSLGLVVLVVALATGNVYQYYERRDLLIQQRLLREQGEQLKKTVHQLGDALKNRKQVE